MQLFNPIGPFEYKPDNWPKNRFYSIELAKQFCEMNISVVQKAGCYIFASRASKGYTPWYVGKTDRSFLKESFTNDKLQKYNEAVNSGTFNTGVMFFLVDTGRSGSARKKRISELESYLIQEAAKKNADLINLHHTGGPDWGIRGALRSGRGTSNKSSQNLKKLLSW